MPRIHAFPNQQKLKSRKTIASLFDRGKSVKAYPLRVIYTLLPFDPTHHADHVQMGVTVPKRSFKKAVDRNRIKRQVRECYRAHHQELREQIIEFNQYLAMMIIYTDRVHPDFERLDGKMVKVLGELQNYISAD